MLRLWGGKRYGRPADVLSGAPGVDMRWEPQKASAFRASGACSSQSRLDWSKNEVQHKEGGNQPHQWVDLRGFT